MAGTMLKQWPSEAWARYLAQVTADQIPEQGHTPTWPAYLEPPYSNTDAHPQPNTFLQLTQVLEWEIWNHDQTRARLSAEQHRSEQLDGHVLKLEQDITQWQQAYHTISVALGEHRNERANLQSDLDDMAAELKQLRRLQPEPQQGTIAHEISTPDVVGAHTVEENDQKGGILDGEARQSSGEAGSADGSGVESWRLGFIREIEDHLR
ncbi:hypothetical protein T440DRAFT_523467 [Plenodomus tracheiphilus IPT5]|uniref:Uncharacterized protein n=1 Tax=Plenodomus tracheiphilus IPT5 TaxID=1408161 RepID=A0A6A7AQL0_9PLEO|nr:hypothetical protein T440DRAFT_523467 [Plenodomus tracheiphilus IPT5]